jgi:adenylate cyclase
MITVVVMDIRGFTVLARQLGETRIAQLIGAFNSDTGAILEKAGTLTLSYIGDAVMAIWEHKLTRTPQAILAGAFRSIYAVHGVVERLQERFGLPQPVRIGIGINSGLASVGNMGSGGTSDFTAMGDVVNKAFRLESSTRHLDADVAFSDEVREILGDSLVREIAQAHRIELKGYAEPCTVYAMPMRDVPRVWDLLESPTPTRVAWNLETTR